MLKIAAACGNGMGSSLIVKMRIVDVFKELGIEAIVEHMSVGDAKNRGKNFDLIYEAVQEANCEDKEELTMYLCGMNFIYKNLVDDVMYKFYFK